MSKIFVNISGVNYGEWDVDKLDRLADRLGADKAEIIAQSEAYNAKARALMNVRRDIQRNVGDQQKILANVADVSTVALLAAAAVSVAAENSETFEEFKANLESNINLAIPTDESDADATNQLSMLLREVQGGAKMPLHVKSLSSVIDEAKACAVGVVNALVRAATKGARPKKPANPADQ